MPYIANVHSANFDDDHLRAIDLLIGPYRSGKTRLLLERAVEQCLARPEQGATIVVPSARYRNLLEKRLLEVGDERIKGVLGLKILTFYQCCERLLRQFGVFTRIVPDTIRPSLVGFVLTRLKQAGQTKTLDPIASFPGTPAALLDLVDELQRSGNSPQDVLGRLEMTAASESRRIELAKVYQSYWESLDQIGYLDQRRLTFKLREVLSDPKGIPATGLGFYAFDGFDRLNALQLHVIDALASRADGLILSFDYVAAEEDTEAEYIWKEASYAEMRSILGTKLRLVERNKSDLAARADAPSMDAFSAPDRYFEMTEVAARIKSAIGGERRNLSKFLVVARSLDRYRSAVEAAFQEAGVDYFMDEPIQLIALPIVQFLLKMCSLHLNGLLRADVISFLRSSYFKHKGFGLTERIIDELDRCSRVRTVLGGAQQWRSALRDFEKDDLWEKLKFVFEILAPPKFRAAPGDYVRWIEDVIERLVTLPSDEEFSDPFEQWEQDKALAQFRNVLALLASEQEILARLNHQIEISYVEFHARLERLVERSNFQQQPRTKDYVLICNAELAPNKRFEQIFVAGLAEGEFPRHSRGAGFLNSDEVENWRRFGIDIQNPRLNPSFESALFKSLIQRGDKQVVFSYPLAEMSGEETTPSSLLREAAAFDPDKIPFVHAVEGMKTRPNSARNAVAAQFWQRPQDEVPNLLLRDQSVASLLHKLEEPLAMGRARASVSGGSPLNGSLVDYVKAGTVIVPLPKYYSPTSLSDYGKCPFRFWLSHVLKVEPYEEAAEGLSPALLGQTYHKALEVFYKRMLADNLSIKDLSDDKLTEFLDAAVKEAVSQLSDRPDFHKDEFWEHRYQEIVFRLKRLLRAERVRALESKESFTPRMMEASFGFEGEGAYPPLAITQGNVQVLIRGRVDRIDLADGGETRVRVVDYKSGSASTSTSDARAGRNLQLPLYILAVEKAILPKSKVVEAEYLSVSAALPFGRLEFENVRTAREVQQLISSTKEHVVNFASGIKQGDFSVKPSALKVCDTCDHRTICRISEVNRLQPSESDEDNGTY